MTEWITKSMPGNDKEAKHDNDSRCCRSCAPTQESFLLAGRFYSVVGADYMVALDSAMFAFVSYSELLLSMLIDSQSDFLPL